MPGEVPGVPGEAVVARQHLEDVRVAQPLRPFQEAALAGHGRQPHQRLQHVAVQLRALVGQGPEIARHRRALHEGRGHVGHAIEPRRAAEQLGDGEQPVLGVLGRPEQARRAELPGLQLEVGRDAVGRRRVADLVSQHVAHPSLVDGAVGEEGRGHEVRIVVGPGVVGRVEVARAVGGASVAGKVVGQQQRALVGVREPGVHHPARTAEDLLHAVAVLGGEREGVVAEAGGCARGRECRDKRHQEERKAPDAAGHGAAILSPR